MSAFFPNSQPHCRLSFRSLTRHILATGVITLSAIALSACGSDSADRANSTDRANNNTPAPEQTIAYARVLWEIEREREAAYETLTADLASDKLPNLRCDQPNSLKVLRGTAREIAVEFCNTAREIVERARLTSDEFNEFTRASETDQTLQAAIEEELVRIRTDESKLAN